MTLGLYLVITFPEEFIDLFGTKRYLLDPMNSSEFVV